MSWIACPCTWPWPTLHAWTTKPALRAYMGHHRGSDRTHTRMGQLYIASYNSTSYNIELYVYMTMHLSRLAIGSSIYAAFAVKIYHCMASACMLYTILSCKKEHKPVKIIALKSMMIYLYGTIGRPIRVWTSHTSIRIWDVPYAYGTKYSCGAEQHKQFC